MYDPEEVNIRDHDSSTQVVALFSPRTSMGNLTQGEEMAKKLNDGIIKQNNSRKDTGLLSTIKKLEGQQSAEDLMKS